MGFFNNWLDRYAPGTGGRTWQAVLDFFKSQAQATTTGITAYATGGQANATQLSATFNEVTTVATAGDSVKLMAAAANAVQIVKNDGAANLAVFPATGDTINDAAANQPVTLAPGSVVTFRAVNATNWETGDQVVEAVTHVKTDTIVERTVGAGVNIDSVLLKDGAVSNAAETIFAGFYNLVSAQDNIVAGTGGAITTTNYVTTINTDAGGDAFTLVDGVGKGQLKKIILVVDGGGNAVITPDNLQGGTTITMNDANDYIVVMWNGSDWQVIENIGCTIA